MKHPTTLKFIDAFAGCGGLSVGLMAAGCEGIFAIEKSPLAFATLKHNLINNGDFNFTWPKWLPPQAMTCEDLIATYDNKVGELAGQVDLIVGGPPCQGFSTAGKRNPADPRNKMTEQYLALVGLVKPRFIVIENVAGFNMKFENQENTEILMGNAKKKSYAEYIATRLKELGYEVSAGLINCADFGVPQNRQRFLMICERKDHQLETPNLFMKLKQSRLTFLEERGLPTDRPVSTKEAISDLEISGRELVPCEDSTAPGFKEAPYIQPAVPTKFQALMRKCAQGTAPNSRRLPRHKPETIKYFSLVQSICRPGFCLSIEERKKAGTRKHSTTVLHPGLPAPTITTLPDDIVHYSEPRILTVRESARLQSFPDWFSFQEKYTTGGKQRKQECPRYTQVGNAVPPLLSEAIGEVLLARLESLNESQKNLSSINYKKSKRKDKMDAIKP
ncbi:DNA cytosine methyltransferase [Undibacterium sp.]|uniref:DNA cytosine methyltransferase n=1 Tax=Undibacterium sp. TaxID=1914977 RepID=UPI00272F79A3|nr:DNA cytosine methyltransferase [Undibacterium sp.]MDP1979397.1 DNA cytosine methyltransferase [Undibacterium sp.]